MAENNDAVLAAQANDSFNDNSTDNVNLLSGNTASDDDTLNVASGNTATDSSQDNDNVNLLSGNTSSDDDTLNVASGNTATDNSQDNDNVAIASGNTATDNSQDNDNVAIASGNTDNSQDNDTVASNNTATDNSVNGIANNSDNSDNSDNRDYSDTNVGVGNQAEGSFNDNSDNSVRNQDSFNVTSSFNTQTLNDDSTTIGVRQYNTGFNDLNLDLGGAFGGKGLLGGGSGDFSLNIDNRSTLTDQSVNQNVESGFGGINQFFGQTANVASGDGSVAAGDDATVDNSWSSFSVGDVNIGNTSIESHITDSFNDFSTNNEWDVEVEFEDSFNDNSTNVDIEDSFTSEIDTDIDNEFEWENEGNIFSPGAQQAGDDAVDLF